MSIEIDDDECEYLFKTVLVGDSGVGKSNLLSRFAGKSFLLDSKPTIGVEFTCQNVRVGNKFIKTQVWDTAGQERFRAITSSYYRGALGALLVYDITRRSTFHSLANWLAEIRNSSDSNMMIVLIANKADLDHRRKVTEEEGRSLAEREGLSFLETSALSNTNVEDAFVLLITKIHETISHKILETGLEKEISTGRTLVNIDNEVSATKHTRCCYS